MLKKASFSKTLTSLVLSLLVFETCLVAKSRPPLTMQLQKSSSESLGDQERYAVALQFTPTDTSERITLKINLPTGYKMLEGVAYWEGQLDKNQKFSKNLIIEGPKADPKDISVDAVMEMGGSTILTKTLVLKLSPNSPSQTSSYPPITLNKTNSNGTQPIRRE
jgi:hypothetical protein